MDTLEQEQHLRNPVNGRVYTVHDWHSTLAKMTERPAEVVDFDFEIIKSFEGPDGVRRAVEARRRALEQATVWSPLEAERVRGERLHEKATTARARAAASIAAAAPTAGSDDLPRRGEKWPDYVKRCPTAKLRIDIFDALFDGLNKFCVDMNEHNKTRNARIDALEADRDRDRAAIAALKAEIVTLSARPTMHDAGTWTAGTVYDAGAIVSYRGSGWICSATHLATGTDIDHKAFRLFVKSGRDGKDLR